MKKIFVTGGTGYMGSRLIQRLLCAGHDVTALVRQESVKKVPAGAKAVVADPFNAATFSKIIPAGAVFVQLLGVAHPSPRKKDLFYQVDLASVKASADAAAAAGVSHFIYVSVSMAGSSLMRDFQQVRREGENYVRSRGLSCTFVRPWYVVGPGHWWPLFLLPLYGLAALVPSWQAKAKAFGLVTIEQMITTLKAAVEAEPRPLRLVEIAQIRKGRIA